MGIKTIRDPAPFTEKKQICILRNPDPKEEMMFIYDPDPAYELTTDNIKKILAIHMRFR